jgi:hypothetical protein
MRRITLTLAARLHAWLLASRVRIHWYIGRWGLAAME